jgi:hypothetical protein
MKRKLEEEKVKTKFNHQAWESTREANPRARLDIKKMMMMTKMTKATDKSK